MRGHNVKYHTQEAATKYQVKIESKRKISHWFEENMVRRSLNEVVGSKILDCPCGTGRIDPILREKFSDILGMDTAQPMLDVYQTDHPERKSQTGNIFELPFEDNTFDWTLCHRLLHHFKTDEERTALLQSIARVSKNGFTFYCWLDTPFSKRGKSSSEGRQSIPREQLMAILGKMSCEVTGMYYACWPFSPKVMVVCRK